jgi:hypothetical protein
MIPETKAIFKLHRYRDTRRPSVIASAEGDIAGTLALVQAAVAGRW